jgi:hypothetical protein
MDDKSPPSSDSARYTQKLWQYLTATKAISEAMEAIKTQGVADELDFERRILTEILLPNLSQAFNSKIAFYADKAGKICSAVPTDSPLVGKILPPSNKYIKNLLDCRESLVIVESKNIPSELNVTGVQSLLVVHLDLDVPWGGYFVGVCNGQDALAYSGEDKMFFEHLMGIVGSSVGYGHIQGRKGRIQAETRSAYERYLDAQLRGEYNLLFRDGGDYAERILEFGGNTSSVQSDTKFSSDDVYSDYLDAVLCLGIQDEPEPEKAQDAHIANEVGK